MRSSPKCADKRQFVQIYAKLANSNLLLIPLVYRTRRVFQRPLVSRREKSCIIFETQKSHVEQVDINTVTTDMNSDHI